MGAMGRAEDGYTDYPAVQKRMGYSPVEYIAPMIWLRQPSNQELRM